MSDHVRTVKTSSGAAAVQIVRYEKGSKVVISHIGSADTPENLSILKEEAQRRIEKTSAQISLFPKEQQKTSPILVINKSEYLGVRHSFIYEALTQLLCLFNFNKLNNQLLFDLVIMRIITPASKLESLEYLSEMFGITYKEGSLYQAIAEFPKLKDIVQENVVAVARKQFAFDFSIVFYDVTTLYFESFTQDADLTDEKGNILTRGLRKNGGLKRTKFLKNKDGKKTEQIINTELVEKTKLLLGIKGYYTNLTETDNQTIINNYYSLWHVEKAFRIAKSDLAMRPIYHFKRQTIEAHILICFMALAVCKYMELKAAKSTKRIIKLLKSITDAKILNKPTKQPATARVKNLRLLLRQLSTGLL